MKAITELKNQVADLSIEMAEKILSSELSDVAKQKELVSKALKESKNQIMKQSRATIRYAKSLIDISEENGVIDSYYDDMVLVNSLC